MSLTQWTMDSCANGAYTLSAPARITAEHLAQLPIPETLFRIDGLTSDAQENKTKRILSGESRAAARLAWPALVGADLVTGIPSMIVIQSGALRFEFERLLSVERAKLDPVNADAPHDLAWPELRAWILTQFEARAALRVQYLGQGMTKEGQPFPRFRLALVGAAAAAGYRAAWLLDATALRAAAPQHLLAAPSDDDAPSDPIPF
jgi:hypothetical protein